MPYSSQAGGLSITYGNPQGQFRNFTPSSSTRAAAGAGKPPVFENMIISNNAFAYVHGPNLVITTARNISVHSNRFLNTFVNRLCSTGSQWHVPNSSLIYLSQVDGVDFKGNSVGADGKLGPKGKACATLGPGATNVNGLPDGVGNAWCK